MVSNHNSRSNQCQEVTVMQNTSSSLALLTQCPKNSSDISLSFILISFQISIERFSSPSTHPPTHPKTENWLQMRANSDTDLNFHGSSQHKQELCGLPRSGPKIDNFPWATGKLAFISWGDYLLHKGTFWKYFFN